MTRALTEHPAFVTVPFTSMRVRSAQRQIFSIALAALFVAAQLSSFTHELLVRHVTCPEHGELIHADEATASLPVSSDDAPALAYRATSVEVSGHGHEHCSVCTARREQLFIAAPSAPLVSAATLKEVVGVERGNCLPAPVALLRLAPKSSPPA